MVVVATRGTPVAVATAVVGAAVAETGTGSCIPGTTVLAAAAAETGTGSCIRNRELCRPSVPWQGAGGRAWTMAAAPLLEL